jgi:rhodanese-related sulfurtransferase
MNRKSLGALMLGGVMVLAVLVMMVMQPPGVPSTIPYGEVTVVEARTLIDMNPELIVVDVRTPEEFADGHIEGATVIPVSELAERLDELAPEDDLLIYCRTGNRSTTAMTILTTNGLARLFHMHEGITGWMAAGYPTVSS